MAYKMGVSGGYSIAWIERATEKKEPRYRLGGGLYKILFYF